jgi:hypothetical protein
MSSHEAKSQAKQNSSLLPKQRRYDKRSAANSIWTYRADSPFTTLWIPRLCDGVMGVISAWIYNVTAKRVEGVEIETD